ncbi:hypothetical protein DL764_001601 [Monosporascus ibericus]|uniref:Uncharacterized protein n=1 Tax=Monosporascus ibericus TaxID=155417 RepID=A0A4Q4TNR4_9PEZI|nr:hypothetical protein DL764_001601 [Monosporascus ibericus]
MLDPESSFTDPTGGRRLLPPVPTYPWPSTSSGQSTSGAQGQEETLDAEDSYTYQTLFQALQTMESGPSTSGNNDNSGPIPQSPRSPPGMVSVPNPPSLDEPTLGSGGDRQPPHSAAATGVPWNVLMGAVQPAHVPIPEREDPDEDPHEDTALGSPVKTEHWYNEGW